MIEGQEIERRRLARELHDETGQALTSVLLGLKTVENAEDKPAALAELRELVVATLQDVRRLAVELRPKALDDFGLVPAVERLVETFVEATGIDVDFESQLGEERLPSEVETTLYRIVQESLTNIAKHAGARRVSVLLVRRGGGATALDRGRRPRIRRGRRAARGHRAGRDARAPRPARRSTDHRVDPRHRDEPRRRGAALVIRIVVVDDHAVVRAGLRLLLEAEHDMEVIGDAGNSRDAVFEVRAGKPDVVLLDVVMPDESGIEALPKLLHEAPAAKVLMLSMQDDPSYVREAFAAGASGYVLKEAADSEVVAAIREVAGGNHYVHPALGARMVAADAAAHEAASSDPLSDREREVLRLLALGHTNQEIAKQLFISVRTAETHRAHIMRKLQLSTRAELVRYAIEHGLLEPPA